MLNPELKKMLLETSLCQSLTPEELDLLIAHNKIVSFNPGEIILQQGKNSDGIFIIIEGVAVVTAKILGEGIVNIATLGHGNVLGEISLIEKAPCAASVIADTGMQCLYITSAYFDMLALFFPETKYKFSLSIAKQVSDRLKDLHNKITTFMTRSDMITRPLFGAVIKSLTKPTEINFAEADINFNKIQDPYFLDLLTKDESHELFKHATFIKATKHCTLIHEEERNPASYIVIHGAVQSSIIHDNKIAKLSVLSPMVLFSSLPAIDEVSPAIINYTTCERAILLRITEADFGHIQKTNIQLWYKIFDLICKSLVALERSADKLDVRLHTELYNK